MRILEVYDNDAKNPNVLANGIKRHVLALCQLFEGDDEISLVPHKWQTAKRWKILNKISVSQKECRSIVSNCDAVHIHGYLTILAAQVFKEAVKQKKRIFYSPHFHPFETINRPVLGKIFFSCFIKPHLKFASVIFTINSYDTKYFSNMSSNVKRIGHWNSRSIVKGKEVQKIEKCKNQILFVGRNHAKKGIDYLYHLPRNRYSVHVVTSGKIERDDFIQHTNISDEELYELYKKSACLVVPSRYEAWSLVTSEALVWGGVPVVMSDRVRIADSLPDADYISIFKYGNYEDFLEKVEKTVGKEVDVEAVEKIFSSEVAFHSYKSAFLDKKTK